ncbi:MAG: prepilin-type N-terminal cleavage/methylation domain-containing protein [Candidatus Saccharimonadales bacterium]
MFKNLKKQAEGFTIIEVMIVLVIAAVILLIVFLAVPALQRNSRNTQRKNDVAGLLAAVNEWSGNNGGKYPSPTNASDVSAALANAKLGFYSPANVGLQDSGRSDGNTFAITKSFDISHVDLITNATCTDSNGTVAKTRSIAAYYSVEAGNGPQVVCLSS